MDLHNKLDLNAALTNWASVLGGPNAKMLVKLVADQTADTEHLADQMALMSTELRRQQMVQNKKCVQEMPGRISMAALLFTVPTVIWVLFGPGIMTWL